MRRDRPHLPQTTEAAALLGAQIMLARRERRWTIAEVAERVGVSYTTIQKIERGDLSVAIGTVFETAAVLGVPLFEEDLDRRRVAGDRVSDHLALLPKRVRAAKDFDDDF